MNNNNENKILVEIEKLNELMNFIGELVLTKNRLLSITENLKLNNNELNAVSNRISTIATDTQNLLTKIRMIEFKNLLDEVLLSIDNKIKIVNKIQEEIKIDKTEISAGVTPEIRIAWPSVSGFIEHNFSLDSIDKPTTEL